MLVYRSVTYNMWSWVRAQYDMQEHPNISYLNMRYERYIFKHQPIPNPSKLTQKIWYRLKFLFPFNPPPSPIAKVSKDKSLGSHRLTLFEECQPSSLVHQVCGNKANHWSLTEMISMTNMYTTGKTSNRKEHVMLRWPSFCWFLFVPTCQGHLWGIIVLCLLMNDTYYIVCWCISFVYLIFSDNWKIFLTDLF